MLWGFATASYQVEGAAKTDGRGPSIWDVFCDIPGKIADGTSGAVAIDHYHRVKEDIAIMKSLGVTAYRFSMSWSRLIPLGGAADPVNPKGVAWYQHLVDELLLAGIEPFVTMHHWDTPLGLQSYGGMLNTERFVQDFTRYASLCFSILPKVKHWITFNEPWIIAILGYHTGDFAPGRSSNRQKSPEGDSSTEPWIVGHTCILAHASAVKTYRALYTGQIGITLNGDWPEPYTPADVKCSQRHLEFWIGWFADPIYLGDYPQCMKMALGKRLPRFTEDEKALVKGSSDFYGMNHYTTNYVRPGHGPDFMGGAEYLYKRDGQLIGPQCESSWLRVVPWGFRKLLNWIYDRYGVPIYVTENGCSVPNENNLSLDKLLQDDFRIEYYKGYLENMQLAMQDGVDIRGYFAWSLFDNFEWASGLAVRFGSVHVDYETLVRTPKASAYFIRDWFSRT